MRLVQTTCRRQHGPIRREQLRGLGLTRKAIEHRLTRGRLYELYPSVYALVPRADLPRKGHWMAAVYACGSLAALSDDSAACVRGFRTTEPRGIEVTVPPNVFRAHRGITLHRRILAASDVSRVDGIPVTTPAATLVALAARLDDSELERAISEADRLELITPEQLRAYVDTIGRRKGVARMRRILDRHTFTLTDSELERRLRIVARKAGLPLPQTRVKVNGYRVDFYWPEMGLVVETDGLRYHRNPAQQVRDRRRDQAHTAAGLTPLRFTHWQVRHETRHVESTLQRVASRIKRNLNA